MMLDPETGLYYDRARYMNAKQGRFIGRDPLSYGGSGFNLYAYANDNPSDRVDPTGLQAGSSPFDPVPASPGRTNLPIGTWVRVDGYVTQVYDSSRTGPRGTRDNPYRVNFDIQAGQRLPIKAGEFVMDKSGKVWEFVSTQAPPPTAPSPPIILPPAQPDYTKPPTVPLFPQPGSPPPSTLPPSFPGSGPGQQQLWPPGYRPPGYQSYYPPYWSSPPMRRRRR